MQEKIDSDIFQLQQIAKNRVPSKVAKSINDLGFRILEQVRLGNKDNVFYMLLRCFKAHGTEFPEELVKAFKPENDKYFKTLIFSFLAPIMGEKK